MHLENLFIQVEVTNRFMDATLQKIKDYLIAEETWLDLGIIFIKVLVILLLTTIVVRIGKRIIKKLFLVRQRAL